MADIEKGKRPLVSSGGQNLKSNTEVKTRGDDQTNSNESFTVFTKAQRSLLAYACSISATFSTISSFIYFPAITALASSLDVSIQAINFTITSYMIVAGIAPSVFGDMADGMGRRPVVIITFTLYMAANIGLALQSNYVALVVLRCLQSAGASSTIAIAYGIIADITTPAERGLYVGVLMGFTNAAPSLGPVLGGLVSQKLSWRWVFWLLAIASGTHFLALFVFLPETSRKLVGNGSLPPPRRINQSLYSLFSNRGHSVEKYVGNKPKLQVPNPLTCLVALYDRANFIVIVVGGVTYTIYNCLAASLSTQMIQIYSLNYLTAGLVYLPAGIGGISAAFAAGRLLNYDYRITAHNHSLPETSKADDITGFPIEKARLRSVFPILIISIATTAGYGWTLQRKTHLAVPLIIQFFSGASQVAVFATCSTLMTDLNSGRSATVQASYNLVRCTLSAAGLAALEAMIKGVGLGWCFTIFAAFGAVCIPLLALLKHCGQGWRGMSKVENPRTTKQVHDVKEIGTYKP